MAEQKTEEQIADAQYPSKEYKKTIFVFTPQELRELDSLATILRMGKLAEARINDIIVNISAPRVGTPNSPDVGIIYNIPKGTFWTYIPKIWCSNCKNKKASMEYKGKYYCNDCLTLVKDKKK